MSASTRRAALGAILAAPLASVPAVATPTVSPGLTQLIEEHDAHRAVMDDRPDDEWPTKGNRCQSGRLRALVAGFPSSSWADTMAKAACLARSWPIEEAEAEIRSQADTGFAYLECIALAIACEVMRHEEGMPCA
ncbi:hypothetical protein MKK69_02845 [Methylobacterium sp. J-026]|uniref:hypothetical protein n=1 Tax=Methylobacterium sp. J-026 TaxID=2836624 RepID=UPI001FBA5ED0|nr:hypothetical protein [Methylobacterium sp. J-026]MCJ2133015.1 hypothetical protein [Methylobacterium sp. J-026]